MQSEKALTFIRSYFDRCLKQFACSNEVCIVIYSRLYYPQVHSESELKELLRQKYHVNSNTSIKTNVLNDIGAFLKSKHVKFF